MRVAYLNFRRFAELFGDDVSEVVARVVDAGVYIGGPELIAFEDAFAAFCGTAHAIGVASGQDALSLTLRAWEIGSGDEVIVPANTAVPTALAVTHAGARLVLCDVEPDSGQLDLHALAAAISPATRIIIPVHLYGHPVDIDPILKLARRYAIHLLEDAAHAHGAEYNGRRCGGLGDAAAFSFYPTKNLGALGDGGAVTTNDAQLADRLRSLRNLGLRSGYDHAELGFNSRLDTLQAAILRWKLEGLDGWNARRRELALLYFQGLADIDELRLPVVRPSATPVWHAFPVLVRGGARDALQRALAEADIGTNVHYRVPIHLQSCYAGAGWAPGSFPVSERRAGELLSLPLDPFHTEAEVAYVVASVRQALAHLMVAP